MNKRLIFTAVVLAFPMAASAEVNDDKAAILKVMDRFDTAIRTRDAETMKALFHDGEIVWRSIARPEVRNGESKDLGKVIPPVYPSGAFTLFANERMRHIPIAERFYDPEIVTDGKLASVNFAYDFTMNCKVTNWGLENWQMVKVDGNWRILSVLYSYEYPRSAEMPARHAQPVAGCVPGKWMD